MNSIDRICRSVSFGTADRIPVIAQIFGHAAFLSNVNLSDYLKNGELLAKCQINAMKYYENDAVFALFDVNVETEAAGSSLIYRRDEYSIINSFAAGEAASADSLRHVDPYKSRRMKEILKAADIMRNEVGENTLVVGCVIGPLTVAMQLIGAEKALFMSVDEPERFLSFMDYSTELIINYGIAQIKAGAHLPVVFEPSGSPAVVPPQFFREFVLPRLKKIFAAFKKAGAAANWLHIAGPVNRILPYYPEAGVDIANFDYCVTPDDVRRLLPETCVNGNVKPLDFVDSSPEEIAVQAEKLMAAFSERKGGFILSSGCEIPPQSKPENVAALTKAVRR